MCPGDGGGGLGSVPHDTCQVYRGPRVDEQVRPTKDLRFWFWKEVSDHYLFHNSI